MLQLSMVNLKPSMATTTTITTSPTTTARTTTTTTDHGHYLSSSSNSNSVLAQPILPLHLNIEQNLEEGDTNGDIHSGENPWNNWNLWHQVQSLSNQHQQTPTIAASGKNKIIKSFPTE